MAGLVAQNAQAFCVGATFHFQHLFAFEFHQARVGQVKGNRNPGNAIRREPLFGKPDVRLESNAAIIQFAVETLNVRFEERAFNLERQIANPQVKQMLVRKAIPGKTIAHGAGVTGVDW